MTPETRDDLMAYIDEKLAAVHDYNSSADAMWETAVATFNYVAAELGTTGFQASYAALMFLREVNGWNFPFAVVKGDEMLYPQYDIPAKVAGFLAEWRSWAGERARQLMAEHEGERGYVHPHVWAHWQELAAIPAAPTEVDG